MLVSSGQAHEAELFYAGKLRHGDSYHQATIDGVPFPVKAGAALFAFSVCSRHRGINWASERFERRTVVVDLQDRRYFVLPGYTYQFRVRRPSMVREGKLAADKEYTFSGTEH